MAKQLKQSRRTAEAVTIDQTFSIQAPDALSVLLVGDFTHWQQNPIALFRTENGIWRVTVALEPGNHRYRFLVDNEWRDEPECIVRVAGGQKRAASSRLVHGPNEGREDAVAFH